MDPESIALTITTINGVANATKTTIEAVRAALTKSKGHSDGKENEALFLIGDLQTRLFELQQIASRLSSELAEEKHRNLQLRTEMSQKGEWTAERKQYKRKKVGHSVFLVHEDDSDTLHCPTCFVTRQMPITVQPVFSQ